MAVRDAFPLRVSDGDQLNDGYFNGLYDRALEVGDGSDGAFNESSGDTAFAGGTVKQYTSFTLTGSATISQSGNSQEPVVILVQSAVSINTSGTCDFGGKGANTPTYTVKRFANPDGLNSASYETETNTNGIDGSSSGVGGANATGWAGNPPDQLDLARIFSDVGKFPRFLVCGGTRGGEGEKSSAGNTVGSRGQGGGSLIIICGGNLTVTSGTFDMSGDNGGNGTAADSNSVAQGGGGGGGGSLFFGTHGTLTDSGTYTITGGTGGTGAENGTFSGNFIGSGGGGASMVAKGTDGSAANDAATNGGNGGDGIAIRVELA